MHFGIQKPFGFTMIELVMVVSVIAVLSLAAIPFLSDDKFQKAELEGSRIESTIHHARALALSRSADYQVLFDTDGGGKARVTLKRVQAGEVQASLAVDDYSWTLDYGLFNTIDCDGGAYIEFDARGRALQGGTLVIAYGALQLTVTISPVTGSITFTEGSP
jgi:prepilin-type N-terminal cleavage/methylation domain-containing protein